MIVKNILLADDHALLRECISAMILRKYPRCHIKEASTWSEVQSLVSNRNLEFDIALFDLFMPTNRGWQDELKEIRQRSPTMPFCILSSSEDSDTIQSAFSLGARGYVQKSSPTQELDEALGSILAGHIYLPRTIWKSAQQQPPFTEITRRQLEILNLMAAGLSNKAIAHRLELTESTVKRHVYNIFQTLQATNRLEAIQIAREKGMLQLQ